jgi:hypothetical protein
MKAGELTVGGVREPPRPIENEAGTRAFVEPPPPAGGVGALVVALSPAPPVGDVVVVAGMLAVGVVAWVAVLTVAGCFTADVE